MSVNCDRTGNFGFDCMAHFADPSDMFNRQNGALAYLAFSQCFNLLPLAALVNQKLLCVHGGIGRLTTLDQIRAIPRNLPVLHAYAPVNQHCAEIMWSDPMNGYAHYVLSSRAGEEREGQPPSAADYCIGFNESHIEEFCRRNRLECIIRAHELTYEDVRIGVIKCCKICAFGQKNWILISSFSFYFFSFRIRSIQIIWLVGSKVGSYIGTIAVLLSSQLPTTAKRGMLEASCTSRNAMRIGVWEPSALIFRAVC